MRSIARDDGSNPPDLSEKEQAELEKARAYFALDAAGRENAKKVDFRAYKLASVKAKLEKLFGGKCAYCESYYNSTAPVDIEHFRPKGKVHGSPGHDGYWWLAANWDNLLPSCIDCNRKRRQPTPKPDADLTRLLSDAARTTATTSTGKKDSFPLADETSRALRETDRIEAEHPLLLNPCADEPSDFLDFSYDPAIGASIVFPKSSDGAQRLNPAGRGVGDEQIREDAAASQSELMGAMSIHVYGLNRLGLVQARTQVIRQLEFLASLIADLDEMVALVAASNAPQAVKDLVASKTNNMNDRILLEMRALAEPTAPYSAVAKAWVDRFVADMRN